MQNNSAQACVLPARLGEEEVGFAGASLSRPQACLCPRLAHPFPYCLEPSFKQLVARYSDLFPEDFVHVFSGHPMALLPFCIQSTGHCVQMYKTYKEQGILG